MKCLHCVFRFQLDPAVNLQDVVDRCPTRMTGADLYALCSDAMTAAIKRKIQQINDGKNKKNGFKMFCKATGWHFFKVRATPSLFWNYLCISFFFLSHVHIFFAFVLSLLVNISSYSLISCNLAVLSSRSGFRGLSCPPLCRGFLFCSEKL